MLIGVICEGQTDFPAIEHFLGNALRAEGVKPEFKSLYPELDKTRPTGGWGNVLLWLANNGPHQRVQRYFEGGLFSAPLDNEKFDALIVQLDTDVIEDESFRSYVNSALGYEVVITDDARGRAGQLANVLGLALQLDVLCENDVKRHVLCPAVDATESWCVAVFDRKQIEVEGLRGVALTNAFMRALERYEGKEPENAYANCSKEFRRRERFCADHGRFWGRVVRSSPHFASTLFHLKAVASELS